MPPTPTGPGSPADGRSGGRRRVLLLSGSLRDGSTSTAVLRTVADVAPEGVEASLYLGAAGLPLYSPDLDVEPLPPAVDALREAVRSADACLVSTPEYAGALPAACKNVLEWTVGDAAPGSIAGKPVGWVNVSDSPTGAADAHESLRTVLGYVGARIVPTACVSVPLAIRAVGVDGRIADPAVRERLARVLADLAAPPVDGRAATSDCGAAPSAGGVGASSAEVTVARLAATDGDEFIAAVIASRALHHPWISPPDTPGRFAEYLDHAGRDDQVAFVIRHAGCGRLVGHVNVSNIVARSFRSATLGYAAFTGHAGRGLMTAGLRAVVGRAFGELGLHRVEANIQPGNLPSLALARRVGFVREGYSRRFLMVDGDWRDHERWALRSDMERP